MKTLDKKNLTEAREWKTKKNSLDKNHIYHCKSWEIQYIFAIFIYIENEKK